MATRNKIQDYIESNQQYYKDLEQLFVSPGWKHFQEYMTACHKQLKESALDIGDMSDSGQNVWAIRGEHKIFNLVTLWEKLKESDREGFEEDLRANDFSWEDFDDNS